MDIEIKWPTMAYVGCILPLLYCMGEIIYCYSRKEMTDVVVYSVILVIAAMYNISLLRKAPILVSGDIMIIRKPPIFQEIKMKKDSIERIKYDKKKIFFHLKGGAIIDIERGLLAHKGVDGLALAFPNHPITDIHDDV